MWKFLAVLLSLVVVGTPATTDVEESVLQKPDDSVTQGQRTDHRELDIRQLWRQCLQQLSYPCIKLVLARVVDHLPQTGLQLLPGITLLANSSRSLQLVEKLRNLLVADTPSTSELHVLHKLKLFLNSLTVKVQMEDPDLLKKVKTLTEEVVDGLVTTGGSEGRKKGGGGALLWSAMALAAVGFASLAAVAGKAMMASLMALMLAGMSALKSGGGGGGGHKSSHVEIIKAPAHIEMVPAHYEAGSHAFEHDHYYTAPSYEYGRKLGERSRADRGDVLGTTTYTPQY